MGLFQWIIFDKFLFQKLNKNFYFNLCQSYYKHNSFMKSNMIWSMCYINCSQHKAKRALAS